MGNKWEVRKKKLSHKLWQRIREREGKEEWDGKLKLERQHSTAQKVMAAFAVLKIALL